MVVTGKNSQNQSDELTGEEKGSSKWWALAGVGMGVFMFALDVYIVNIALPVLVEFFHTDFAIIQWVILIYLLMLSVMVMGAARLGDIWNKKRLFLGGLSLFTISSLLCGLAPTVSFLIGFRALQGLGAVFISALGSAIITEVFPKEERGRGLGIISGIFLLGIALGPTVGGLLLGLGTWRWSFLINLPIGLIASLIVILFVPSSAGKSQDIGANLSRFDIWGVLVLSFTLTCFAVGMTLCQLEGFHSLKVWIPLLFSALGLAGFLVVEARVSDSMLDLKMFKDLQFSFSLLLSLIVNIAIAAVVLMLPFFLELVKHYSPQKTGILITVAPLLAGLIALLSGALSDRFSPRIISMIGLILMLCGCINLSTFNSELTVPGFIIRIAFHGLGLGMFVSPNNSIVMGAVSQERLGIASGLLSLTRSLGQTAGLPLVGLLFSSFASSKSQLTQDINITNLPTEALVFAHQMTFSTIAPILIVSIGLAAFLWWQFPNEERNCS